jgi:hypothetical protein
MRELIDGIEVNNMCHCRLVAKKSYRFSMFDSPRFVVTVKRHDGYYKRVSISLRAVHANGDREKFINGYKDSINGRE